MNLDSCGGCHSQPAIGGTSPAVNPQVAFATAGGARDRRAVVHPRERPGARSALRAERDGTPDGGVHALFTITGRPGADGCTARAAGLRRGELARPQRDLPHSDADVRRRPDRADPRQRDPRQPGEQRPTKNALGIAAGQLHVPADDHGQTNNNGNDGTIARFGWKAQNKSLLLFSGEAYNVEMGITNELFQTERDETRELPVRRHVRTSITDTGRRRRRSRRSARSRSSPSSCASWRRRRRRRHARRRALDRRAAARPFDERRLRALPHADAARPATSTVAALRDQDGQPVLRPAACTTWAPGSADGVSQGQAGAARVPHRAALGPRPADLLPARRPDRPT